jgi:uncharacterized protein DUF4339
MSQRWYYARGKSKHGPVSAKELKQLAESGKLQPTDLVWRTDMPDWRKASTIKGLFPVHESSLPAPVVPTAKPGMPASSKIDKTVPIDDLRRRLTAFAAMIPHHDLKNLGDEITIVGTSSKALRGGRPGDQALVTPNEEREKP